MKCGNKHEIKKLEVFLLQITVANVPLKFAKLSLIVAELCDIFIM